MGDIEKIIPKNGVVVMLDALGVGQKSTGECEAFLKKRDELIDRLSKSMNYIPEGAGEDVEFFLKSIYSSREIVTFGDTIILIFDFGGAHIEKEDFLLGQVYSAIQHAGDAVSIGIEIGLLLRGAMASGEYLFDKKSNTLLGPALSDVASWYEKMEMVGVCLTPTFGKLVELMFRYSSEKFLQEISRNCTKYDVALRGCEKLELAVCGWPNYYLNMHGKDARLRFFHHIGQYAKPIYSGGKMVHTVEYFDWYINRFGC